MAVLRANCIKCNRCAPGSNLETMQKRTTVGSRFAALGVADNMEEVHSDMLILTHAKTHRVFHCGKATVKGLATKDMDVEQVEDLITAGPDGPSNISHTTHDSGPVVAQTHENAVSAVQEVLQIGPVSYRDPRTHYQRPVRLTSEKSIQSDVSLNPSKRRKEAEVLKIR